MTDILPWSSKVEGVPPVAQSGPPRYQEGIDIDSAMDGITMRPLQECVQPVLGGTQGQSSRGKTSKEKRCPPSVPEQGAHSSESRELDMGVALELYCPPMPHVLSTASLGDPPNIGNSPALDPVGTQGSAILSETND